MKYWAEKNVGKRNHQKEGPFTTLSEAIDAFRKAHPFAGQDWQRASKRNQFMTGYGEFGAQFDIRWHDA